jgi:hypothetical protein
MMKYLLLFLCVLFFHCQSPKKVVDQSKKSGPAPMASSIIGLNEIRVEGRLIKQANMRYFVVERILERGRSTPVISKGQKIELKAFEPESIPLNKKVLGTLISSDGPESGNKTWKFKKD